MKSNISYDFNVFKFISPKDDYRSFQNSNTRISGNFIFGCYSFSESSQILHIYAEHH